MTGKAKHSFVWNRELPLHGPLTRITGMTADCSISSAYGIEFVGIYVSTCGCGPFLTQHKRAVWGLRAREAIFSRSSIGYEPERHRLGTRLQGIWELWYRSRRRQMNWLMIYPYGIDSIFGTKARPRCQLSIDGATA